MFGSAWLLAMALALQSIQTAQTPRPPAPPPTVQDRPFQDLFRNLGKDIRRLPNVDSAWIAGAGLVGGLVAHNQDQELADWVTAEGDSSYPNVGDVLGSGWVQAGGAVAAYAGGLMMHSPTSIHVGSDLIRAQVLNGLLTSGLKVAAQRERPSGGKHSFPSGHTSATFASAAVLQGHFGWKVGVPAYVTAGFVGWTRVRGNHHWMSDVVAGASLGTIVGHTVTIGHRQQWSVVPVKTAGGVAVFMVRR